MEKLRIDKWLWAVRIFKTRSLAAAACKAGHVQILGQAVKASRDVKPGDLITVKLRIITKSLKVIGLTEKRVGAKLVPQYAEDQTPASEYEKLKEKNLGPSFVRDPGFGRPTKKDRRALARLLSDESLL